MSSPHVAGAAALIVSLGVTEPSEVESVLRRSARKLPRSAGGRAEFGAGALDAASALRRVALGHVVGRLLALSLCIFLLFRSARRERHGTSPWRPRFLVPALLTGPGLLFFAPFLLPRHNDFVDVLARPMGEWDLLFGTSLHGFLPLCNVLWPFGLSLILLGVRGARPVLAGFATGCAAFLGALALQGGVYSPLGQMGLSAFAGVNAILCLLLARLVLRDPRRMA
jgi:serine protease